MYLNQEDLQNLKRFHYKSDNLSLVYNHVISPLLDNYLIHFVPKWIAPNLLTVLSLGVNVLTLLIVLLEAGNNFSYQLSKSTCLLQGITHLVYIILDNLDGKQARRTKSASPLGLLFDHGCDVFTTFIMVYNMSHLLMLGNEGIISSLILFCLTTGFWVIVYEEYVTGIMYFGYLNGADEGNVTICVISFLSGILGPTVWNYEIVPYVTLRSILLLVLFTGTISCVLHTLRSIQLKNVYKFIRDSLVFLFTISFPYLVCITDPKFYSSNLTLILSTMAILFSRAVIDLQVCIVTKRKARHNNTSLLTIIVLILSLYLADWKFLFLLGALVTNGAILIVHIYNYITQIRNHLGIKIFSINTP